MTRPQAWAALVLAAACFGLDTTLSSFVLRYLRAADLFVVETGVGTVTVWGILLATRRFHRPRSIRPILVLGLVEPGAVFLLFNLGLTRTSAVSAGLLASTDTVLAVVLAVAVLHERLHTWGWVSVAAGTVGTALVSISSGGGRATPTGDLLVLAGSAVGASYFLLARRLRAGDATLSGTACQLLAGCAVALAYASVSWPIQGSAIPSASPGVLLAAVAAGLIGTAVPFYLLNRALESTPTSTSALLLNLIPVFAVITALALLGETLTLLMALGGGLILTGLVALARREAARAKEKPVTAPAVAPRPPVTPIPCGDALEARPC